MSLALDRIESAVLAKDQYDRLLRILESEPVIVGSTGERLELPEPLAHLLALAARAMRHGQSVALIPEKESLTTQQAADYMGFSRPFLIRRLEQGEIPFHMRGTHRRILFRDLREYEGRRDRERRKIMDDMFDKIDADGMVELGLDPALGKED